jgi:hypothetical protein
MKKYVVAVISFFDSDVKQFKVDAENEYEAVKKGVLAFTKEECKAGEIEFHDRVDVEDDGFGNTHYCSKCKQWNF